MITNERKQEAVVLIRSDKKPIYIGGLTSHPESGVGPVAAHGLVTQTYQNAQSQPGGRRYSIFINDL